ncbi:MAG: TldD/PmbA family protein [Kiritimatiellae bacterium]|nr:TldD/PmbA family protein [Kiritimatiellia bacterium]
MNEPDAMALMECAIEGSDADAVRVSLHDSDSQFTRFADNAITENVRQHDCTVQITCSYGLSHGSAQTNELGEESLKQAVQRAQNIARLSPPDPEHMPPLPACEAERYPEVHAWFDRTVQCSPHEKAESIRKAATRAGSDALRLSGGFGNGFTVAAFANSAGLRAFHRQTYADARATALTDSSSGWAMSAHNDIGAIDLEETAERAAAIARAARNPRDAEPGVYTAVLSAAAVGSLLPFVSYGFDSKAADEGHSFMRNRLGKPICGPNITLRSDPTDPRCPGSRFLQDGLAARPITWVNRGVAENLIRSRYWAQKKGNEPTGMPSNLIMEGGDKSSQDMMASTERGVLVTRVWYVRTVDPMVPSVTGMTRDGLFLIEDGRIAHPIKNMRFNVDLLQVFSHVVELGPVERLGAMLAPAVKVRDFALTSTTGF